MIGVFVRALRSRSSVVRNRLGVTDIRHQGTGAGPASARTAPKVVCSRPSEVWRRLRPAFRGLRHAVFVVLACLMLWPGLAAAESPSAEFDRWLARAEQGEALAQLTIGEFYERGYGRPRHYVLASNFFKKAAEQGDPEALYRLGRLYLLGLGLPQKPEKAIAHFEQARLRGSAEASLALGQIAEEGIAEPVDLARARALYLEAAMRGLARGRFEYGRLVLASPGEETPDGVSRAEGWQFIRKAAEAGVPEAQFYIAQHAPSSESSGYLLRAADAGHPGAALAFAEQLLDAPADSPNLNRARGYLYIAASALLPEAQYRLGLVHARGEGVPIDDDVATYWFGRAAMLGHSEAQALLCMSLARGRGITEDLVAAVAWCRVAREGGSQSAAEAEPLLVEPLTPPQLELVDVEYDRIQQAIPEERLKLRAVRY